MRRDIQECDFIDSITMAIVCVIASGTATYSMLRSGCMGVWIQWSTHG